MLEFLEAVLTGTCTEKAREHDQRVAREYDEQNQRDVSRHKLRNGIITGGAGLAILGAVAAYGISKLSEDKNKNKGNVRPA